MLVLFVFKINSKYKKKVEEPMLIMAKLHFSYKYHAIVKHRGGEKNLQAWGWRKFNGRRGGKLT
jgi:hypothetical protein